MLKWIREWMMLSVLMVAALGMVFMMWMIWPLVPARFPTANVDLEGMLAMLMLFVVVLGFGKLICRK